MTCTPEVAFTCQTCDLTFTPSPVTWICKHGLSGHGTLPNEDDEDDDEPQLDSVKISHNVIFCKFRFLEFCCILLFFSGKIYDIQRNNGEHGTSRIRNAHNGTARPCELVVQFLELAKKIPECFFS